ncbi:hypothetical protein ES332_A13G213700v1 [Gossypium tomentosum]|uniref:Uncharacterized protein n=1 Tax=Gossypium tomentosum TaxID=34277 RepID=A0A5D2MP01_GOSTO|nr:hypothetical protein ES332_A13G213700v1 [Gossypium tomentosum]
MSRRWEKSIEDWYSKSRTANLEYLDLETSSSSRVTNSQIAHNLAVVYDRTNLLSRVLIKDFKLISESLASLDKTAGGN